jgi:hypothetical protein
MDKMNSQPAFNAKSGRKRKREKDSEEQGTSVKRFKETECPYLNTIKKHLLDFDFK